MSLRARQHLWRIDVLPPSRADIDATNQALRGHQSDSVCQTAVAPTAAGLRLFEIIGKFPGADKKTGIDCIVIAQVFSDGDESIALHPDFHRVIQIENGIELFVDCQVELVRLRFAQEKIDNRSVEEMVTHR